MYHGDIHLGDTVDIKFVTTSASTGAPTTLSGTPVISAYVGNSTTELTAGITLTVDFDTRTGLNNVRVVATSGNGYAAATNVQLVITTGTVGGTSAVGYVVGTFSIDCRGMNQILGTAVSTPATAGILDVNAKNINNVATTSVTTISANQGTTQPLNFTGTAASALVKTDMVDIAGAAVSTSTAQLGVNVVNYGGSAGTFASGRPEVNTARLAGQTVTAATGVTFPTTLASPTNITAGVITTVTNLTNAPTAGDFTSTMKTSIEAAAWDATLASHLTSGSTGAALNAAGSAGDPWGTALPGAYGAGTAGKIIGDNLNATVTSRMASYTQPTGFLAATFPTTVASPTNITAGTITTVTNLTNAPTAGDFTATMKTSIGTAVAASAVASVTGNVGGNVTGSVGSVVGAVGSVTGAVGSVTGNVGGNVTGTVASVVGNVGGNVVGSVASVTAAVTISSGTGSGQIDLTSGRVNVGKINSVTVNGAGVLGNEWGP